MTSFTRPVSPNERFWLAADRLAPFVVAMVLEGRGELDVAAFTRAAAAVSPVHPGARLVLRGAGPWLRWQALERDVPVRVVAGDPAWAFLQAPMDVRAGPTCEVVLWPGAVPRVIVRAHHAVMDGGGVATFGLDLFRALRGEAPLGALSTVTDVEVARRLGRGESFGWRRPAPAPTGLPEGGARGVAWRRLALPRAAGRVVPRVVHALGRHAGGPLRVHVASDLRRHLGDGERSTANLVGVLSLDVTPELDERALRMAMMSRLRARAEGRHLLDLAPVRFVPTWLLARGVRASIAAGRRTGRYTPSVALSYMDFEDETPSGAGFATERAVGFPPLAELLACIIGIVSTKAATDAVVAVPECLAGGGRLDALCARVEEALRGDAE